MSKNSEKNHTSHNKDTCEHEISDNNRMEKSCECGCSEKTKQSNSHNHEKSSEICHVECDDGENEFCSCCSGDLMDEKDPLWKRKHVLVISISAAIFSFALYLDFFTSQSLLSELLFLIVVGLSGYNTIKSGIKSLLKGRFTINILITFAAFGAFLIGEGAEGASVFLLFYLAEYLEEYASSRARKSIKSLLKMAPEKATIRRNGESMEINVSQVDLKDVVLVKPGDKIPVDGEVKEGISSVNQAAITGESLPITKNPGDPVFAGTLNEEGYLEIEVSKKSTETVISKIIDLVKEAQSKKSPTEQFIEKFAKYYTPAVMGIAAMVAVIPTSVLGQSFDTWFYRALVLLVVSCPCALAISTPVAMVSGITAGTRKGLLIKGGEFIEEMQNIQTVIFDKTGTLTEGNLEVTDLISLNNFVDGEILSIAAALESKSKHPLARAIVKFASENNEMPENSEKGNINDLTLPEVEEFESITGEGLKGKVNDDKFIIGKKTLFDDLKISNTEMDSINEIISNLEKQGKTVIILGKNSNLMALFGLMDKIREKSLNTIKSLKENKIHTLMLTGDNEGTARAVSAKIGVDTYYSNLLPQDKVDIVEKLIEQGQHVAVVGDGVNDAPALALSNIGIAMGVAGSDVAIETADVALMNDDISNVNYLIDLSKRTMAVVKQNVTVSIIIKSSFALMAVLGFVSLWMAVAIGDMGLSLAVIINAMRIGIEK
ncbi:MAG: cation-translocating P-type ATPase [Methanobacteriaceae archaeon]|nr:cation-translocating P-type ATPase [Methanobacteriaceae archaeon]